VYDDSLTPLSADVRSCSLATLDVRLSSAVLTRDVVCPSVWTPYTADVPLRSEVTPACRVDSPLTALLVGAAPTLIDEAEVNRELAGD